MLRLCILGRLGLASVPTLAADAARPPKLSLPMYRIKKGSIQVLLASFAGRRLADAASQKQSR